MAETWGKKLRTSRKGRKVRKGTELKPPDTENEKKEVFGFPSPPRVSFPIGDDRFAICGVNDTH